MPDIIRCDLEDYLLYKWVNPSGNQNRPNEIVFGSSLRVKDGELAVFVYSQKDGTQQDFIMGPYDKMIETANFPILSRIVGIAWGGKSPFQAEIYFINLAGNIQIKFGVPFFDCFDPRLPDFPVPVALRGALTFNITDYKSFIKLNRLIDFSLEKFKGQIKAGVISKVKGTILSIVKDIPLVQVESRIEQVGDIVKEKIKDIMTDFGVNLKRFDIEAIEVDKTSEGYLELRKVTKDIQMATTLAQTDVNIKNMYANQQINEENTRDTLKIQREEAQRGQKLQTENQFLSAHALNQQSAIGLEAASHLGEMGQGLGAGSAVGGGGGLNPANMMAGLAIGGALGGQMANMINNTMGTKNIPTNQPQGVICNKCNTVNQVGAKFCSGCGGNMQQSNPAKINCPSCSSENDSNSKFCSSCGKPIQISRVCKGCGSKLNLDAKFCPNCGAQN